LTSHRRAGAATNSRGVALAVVREPWVLTPVEVANMVDFDAECRSAVTTPGESTYGPGATRSTGRTAPSSPTRSASACCDSCSCQRKRARASRSQNMARDARPPPERERCSRYRSVRRQRGRAEQRARGSHEMSAGADETLLYAPREEPRRRPVGLRRSDGIRIVARVLRVRAIVRRRRPSAGRLDE
jgi:hypothetical protein